MTFCHKSLIGILFVYIRVSPCYCSSKGTELSNPSKLNKNDKCFRLGLPHR